MADAADITTGHDGQAVLTMADLNTTVNHEPRIEDERLAAALGFRRAADIRDLIERHINPLGRLGEVIRMVRKTSRKGGRPGKTYWLNKRQCLYLCTKSETPNATEATIIMVEVFDAHLRGTLTPAKPVRVGEHRRALPRPPRATTQSAALNRDGLALMRIGTETVLVDLHRFDIGPDERAVMFDSDGKLTVEPVKMEWPHMNWCGRRFGHTRDTRKHPGRSGEHRPGVWVIGAVVASQPSDTSQDRSAQAASTEAPPRLSRPATPPSPYPARFDPGSHVAKDLLIAVRSANHRMSRNPALSLGRALAETLEDIIARKDDPTVKVRGAMFDWDERRATDDLCRTLRAEGRDPAGAKAREVRV